MHKNKGEQRRQRQQYQRQSKQKQLNKIVLHWFLLEFRFFFAVLCSCACVTLYVMSMSRHLLHSEHTRRIYHKWNSKKYLFFHLFPVIDAVSLHTTTLCILRTKVYKKWIRKNRNVNTIIEIEFDMNYAWARFTDWNCCYYGRFCSLFASSVACAHYSSLFVHFHCCAMKRIPIKASRRFVVSIQLHCATVTVCVTCARNGLNITKNCALIERWALWSNNRIWMEKLCILCRRRRC